MMQMMQMMQQMKGWGGDSHGMGGMGQGPTPAPSWSTGSPEDVAAYLKWCEENQVRIAEQKKQMMAKEAEERKEAMESEWKMWEKKMTMTASFEKLGYEIMEMKHKYYYLVVFEFLKFCKCSDFTSEIERFFHHEGFETGNYEEFDLADLQGVDST